ncbi:hypothetical protein [Rhodococcus sp. NPDC058521]|uniref:hypothetical protein n=1 Tax=Rhodococcus sp. NPDC058521 TaxID=3346536 RepID=UPI003648301E
MLLPIFGADGGYNTAGDVLVNETADGVDLNKVWEEIAAVTALWNNERTRVASLLSYNTTDIATAIPQSVGSDSFEEASEFGEPTGVRAAADTLLMGYDFKDFDLASRFTWKALRDMTSEQITSVVTRILEADNKNINTTVLDRLFNPAERLSPENHRVFGLYTGTDGIVPPPYLGKEFPESTSHYLASGAAVIDSADIEDMIRLVTSKGYGRSAGSQLLILANPQEGEIIQTWKRGEETATGIVAAHDFILSQTAPAYLTQENIIGKIAPGEYGELPVAGSYGPAWLISSEYVPAGYVAVVASGGPNSDLNPVGFRQHKNPAYQGLRIIPGRDQRYPLQDSFFSRGFGTGVRYRGAAAVLQVTPEDTYTAPTLKW